MNTLTVSFFGHREIEHPFEIEKRLESVVTDLIKKKDYIEFLVGRDGEFDQLASSTIRRVAKRLEYGNTALVLVLPYMRAEYRDNEDRFHEYYDEVEICEESATAYPAAAFKKRNRSMVDRSDLIICCVERKEGGAYSTMRYAERSGKEILNLADDKLFSDKM
ncbi:MAG: hypothetical protein II820_06560 [Ruminiclostridium sp.]|nr:hypothetical protein [Ruminiclostridium sp.]